MTNFIEGEMRPGQFFEILEERLKRVLFVQATAARLIILFLNFYDILSIINSGSFYSAALKSIQGNKEKTNEILVQSKPTLTN